MPLEEATQYNPQAIETTEPCLGSTPPHNPTTTFDVVARRLVNEIRPRSVLLLGEDALSLGHALTALGTTTWAVDRDGETLLAPTGAKQEQAALVSWRVPLRQTYDLVICHGVLDELSPEDAHQLLDNVCQYTSDLLLLPARGDALLPPGDGTFTAWVERFAEHGFFRDVDYDASYLGSLAVRMRRIQVPISRVIAAYEGRIWRLDQESSARRHLSIEQRREAAQRMSLIARLRAELTDCHEQITRLQSQVERLESQLESLRTEHDTSTRAVELLRGQFEEKTRSVLELQERFAEKAQLLLDLELNFADKKRNLQDLSAKLLQREQLVTRLEHQNQALERQLADLQSGIGWSILQRARAWRVRLAPLGSRRERLMSHGVRGIRVWRRYGMREFQRRARQKLKLRLQVLWWRLRTRGDRDVLGEEIEVDSITTRPDVARYTASVSIVVCVHNALADVERCLESVVQHATGEYALILVDDGSDEPTRTYLEAYARDHQVTLLRNDQAQGYTRAANRGLRQANTDYIVLLNSDTIVTPYWLDRMIACAESDPEIGLVGPLSNTASWQSIPQLESQGDWADNPLPPGVTTDQMGQLVAQHSARLYPPLSFLNGFCLLVRKAMLDAIGPFDEEHFGAGYGEENDYCLRARQAGWSLRLADDAYVYHAQSRSYSHEARKQLCDRAGERLAQKHDPCVIQQGVDQCRDNRVLEGIRARSREMLRRDALRLEGSQRFSGRRVLYVLPISAPGGGGNIVLLEAAAMRAMNVDVAIFNLTENRAQFRKAYPGLDLPVIYGEVSDLPRIARSYDAVIATHNASTYWLAPITRRQSKPVRAYYVQDFEPYFYPSHSDSFSHAWGSYTLFPDMVRFTKTEWTRDEVRKRVMVDSTPVGASVDVDLYRPRPRQLPDWPERPLRIAAMVRPESAHRSPEMTVRLLAEFAGHFGPAIEIVLFGTTSDNLVCLPQGRAFPWKLAGVLPPARMATLLNEVDVFVDFSTYQAMGLTALEAMCCGAATIVPTRGGAHSFARHEENSLIVDTSSYEACRDALLRLACDHDLRRRLQHQALHDAAGFFPERPAFNTLLALFAPDDEVVA